MTHTYGGIPVFTAGWNTGGYSPDPDTVGVFLDQESARQYVIDSMDRLAESIADIADDEDTIGLVAVIDSQIADVVANLDDDYSAEFSIAVDDGRSLDTIYWVNSVILSDVFGYGTDPDEYDDYRDIVAEYVESVGEDVIIPGCNCAVCMTRRADPTDVIAIESARRGLFVWPVINQSFGRDTDPTAVDSAWIDSPDPELRARHARYIAEFGTDTEGN